MPYYKITEVVVPSDDDDEDKAPPTPRVVEADNAAVALRHVAQTVFEVSKPLKPTELVELMGAGVKPEKAAAAN